jgi:predicted  nucleic acid-binding Zn-ribbon protein
VASDFVQAQKALESNTTKVSEMETKLDDCAEQVAILETEIEEQQAHIATLTKEQHESIHSQLGAAKKTEETLSKSFVKVTAAYSSSKSVTKNAQTELKSAKKYLEESNTALDTKQQQLEAGSTAIQSARDDATQADSHVTHLQEVYQNMCAGISNSAEGEEGRCLPEQISKAHSDANTASARAKQAKMKFTHLGKNIKVQYVIYFQDVLATYAVLYETMPSYGIAYSLFFFFHDNAFFCCSHRLLTLPTIITERRNPNASRREIVRTIEYQEGQGFGKGDSSKKSVGCIQ